MTTIGISDNASPPQQGFRPRRLATAIARRRDRAPCLEGQIITVPEVRMSPDLKLATIYVMPLGGRDTDVVLAALARNKKFLRGEIAHRVNLKFAPDLRFRVDERFDEAERIEKLLRTPAVQRDLAPDSDDK
jgi:ribosome-binding factor A